VIRIRVTQVIDQRRVERRRRIEQGVVGGVVSRPDRSGCGGLHGGGRSGDDDGRDALATATGQLQGEQYAEEHGHAHGGGADDAEHGPE